MGFLAMAALAAAMDLSPLPVREPAAAAAEAAFAMRVETLEAGDGSAVVQAGAGYVAGKANVSLSARWQRVGIPGWPDTGDVSLGYGRDVGEADRIELTVWRGLTRVSGGAGLSVTWSRRFGP